MVRPEITLPHLVWKIVILLIWSDLCQRVITHLPFFSLKRGLNVSFSSSLLHLFFSSLSLSFVTFLVFLLDTSQKPTTRGTETFIIMKNTTIESNIKGGMAKVVDFGVEGRLGEDGVWVWSSEWVSRRKCASTWIGVFHIWVCV